MKNFLTILMLCGFMGGYAQITPRYAASTQTWVFGDQTWSDAIHIPECNKSNFGSSNTRLACRSYTENDTTTWYYYNWAYVNANKNRMCPAPWRMPTLQDIQILITTATADTIFAAWGYSGYAESSSVTSVGSRAYYWSSTEASRSGDPHVYAYELNYSNGNLTVNAANKSYGQMVRCVK